MDATYHILDAKQYRKAHDSDTDGFDELDLLYFKLEVGLYLRRGTTR
jgi:hypothetical protein